MDNNMYNGNVNYNINSNQNPTNMGYGNNNTNINSNINNNYNQNQYQNYPQNSQNYSGQPNYSNNGNNNKKSSSKFILLIIVIVIIVGVFLVFKNFNLGLSNSNSGSSIFNPNQPIVVKKDGKYGYINNKGKFVIEPVFEYASKFNGNYAIVKGIIDVEGNPVSMYQVIDTKGNVKASSKYSSDIKYISEHDIWIINDELYNSSMNKISADGIKVEYKDDGYLSWKNAAKKTGGIMTSKGKITYSYKFAEGESYIRIDPSDNDNTLKENYCRVIIDNKKYAIVNCDSGKVIYNFTDKYIFSVDDNIFKIKDHDTYKLFSVIYVQNDKIAYQSENDNVELNYYSSGYVQIRDKSKDYSDRYSYYDTKTGQVVKEQPSSSSSSSISDWESFTGLKEFSCSSGIGLMKGENITLSCEWYDIDYFGLLLYQYLKSNGKDYVMAEKDSKTYIINLKNGKTVTEFNSSYVYDDELSTFIEYTDKDSKKKVVYNLLSGKSIETDSNNSISTYPNYVTIKENDKVNYYNTDLKLIYTENK